MNSNISNISTKVLVKFDHNFLSCLPGLVWNGDKKSNMIPKINELENRKQ